MKEFKYCHEEITMGVEIPVTVCETQKEMVAELVMQKEFFDFSAIRMNEVEEKRINGYYNLTDGTLHEYAYREAMKEAISGTDEEMMYIIYKDGSEYWNGADEVHGKFKRYGIKRAIISTPWGYTVFGDFAINDMGDVTIEESDIEEYGVYAGQYDVKEQEAQGAVEQTEVEETAETDDSGFEYYSVETAYEVDFRDRQNEVFKTYSEAEKTAGDNIILEVDLIVRNDKKAVSEHDKEVFEDETDEIECRCIWYHHNGVKGMIAQDTKRVIKSLKQIIKGE